MIFAQSFDPRFGLREHRFRVFESGLIGPAIDHKEYVVFVHELAGLEADIGKIAIGSGHDVDAFDSHHFACVLFPIDDSSFEWSGDRRFDRRQRDSLRRSAGVTACDAERNKKSEWCESR
jgi:hypothetical protein